MTKIDGAFHPNLPTFLVEDVDYQNMLMIVRIPCYDLPAYMLTLTDDNTVNHKDYGKIRVKASDDEHADWYEHLDKNYKERAGEFRPRMM